MKDILHHRPANPARTLVWTLAILSAVFYMLTPRQGDDAVYTGAFSFWSITWPVRQWLFMYFHWLRANGRMANYLAPILLGGMPQWLAGVLCGCATWLMYYITLRWARLWRDGSFKAVLLVALIALAFPWWDSMQLIDCQLNYIWASAFALSAIWLITRPTPLTGWWRIAAASVFAIGAGMMHEGATAPLTFGLFVWWWWHGRLPGGRTAVAVFFMAGVALATFAPGIILRASDTGRPNDTILWLFLKSYPLTGITWAVMAAACFWRRTRAILRGVLRSPLMILALATVPATAIGLYSGIVGRPGWFPQIYALAVLFAFLREVWHSRLTWAAWVLSGLVIVQMAAAVWWQAILYRDVQRFETLYRESADGTVYMDFHRDTDAPAITLNRTRGVPDAEDTYLMYWHMKRHGEPGKFPIVIPEAARTAPVPSALPKGDSLSADIPAGAYVHVLNPDSPPTFFLPRPGGHILVGQHFCRGSDTLVYWSPLILDPGDRLYLEELTPYQKEKP